MSTLKKSLPDFNRPVAFFLDANVLFSDWQRALWLAMAETLPDITLHHSEVVLDECFRNLIKLERLSEHGAEISRQHWESHALVQNVSAFDAYLPDVRCLTAKQCGSPGT